MTGMVMMSPWFFGCVWDAPGQWCETQQNGVSLVFFGFAELIIGAVQPVQNSQNTVTLIKPEHTEAFKLINVILVSLFVVKRFVHL